MSTSPPPALKYVYIVQQASYPSSGEGGDEILAVYSRLDDANQKAKSHIDAEYAEPEDCEEGQDENGCFWWSAADVGEGDAVRVYVVRWEVL
ncbi:hypothetical protein PVAG01_03721 [Phlyctema vagabunda]|uniref:Uncharacterized protein n=1 Tax=Phlyctema vagabunda TaxID=108571 RepID=A0ABR4PM78_9HELO